MMPTPHRAIAMPRWWSGKISQRIACEIGMTGPPPSPWKTRANTRNVRFGAIPERNELTVNRTVPREERADREQDRAYQEEAPAPDQPREPARRGDDDRVRREERRDHPRHLLDARRER